MKTLTRMTLFLVIALLGVFEVSAQTSNLLVDPGFEGQSYTLISRDPTDDTRYHVPNGWGGGVVRNPGGPSWINAQPNGYPNPGAIKFG